MRASTSGRSVTGLLVRDVLQADVEQQPDMGVVERVVDVSALLAVANEPARAQQPQVVRAGSLRQSGDCRQVADAQLAGLEQRRDQPHATGIGEHAEGLGQVLEHLLGGESFEYRLDALGLDAFDRAAVDRRHGRNRCLHNREDNIPIVRGRRVRVAALVALIALVEPQAASAHASLYDYNLPLPLWVFLLGGALAVLISAPAAALAVRSRGDWTSSSFYRYVAPFHLGAIGTFVATVVLLDGLVGGLFGSPLFTANPLTLLFWVDFWVGLGVVCALVGNVFDFVSPLSAAGPALERVLSRRGLAVRRYPERLGVWPSVALLLAWSWVELVWLHGDHPLDLAVILLVYFAAQLAAMAIFGTEVWLGARGVLHGACPHVRPLRAARVLRRQRGARVPGSSFVSQRASGSAARPAGSTRSANSVGCGCAPTAPASAASRRSAPAAPPSS